MAGRRGPLRLLTGSEPAEDERTAQNVVASGEPEKPDAVKNDEQLSRMWDAVVPSLELASPSDATVIEMALRHLRLAELAYAEVKTVTVDDKNHGGVKKHPAEAVLRAESDMFLRYAQQLGMTPAARARIPMPGGGDGETNPFAPPASGG